MYKIYASAWRDEKREAVLKHLQPNPEGEIDLNYLKLDALCAYGLVDDDIRRIAWPLLAQVDCSTTPKQLDSNVLEAHAGYQQVQLDVNRMRSLLPADISEDHYENVKCQTMRLIMSVLVDNPTVHYYQGFHDICYVFLSVLGEETARLVLNKLVPTRLRIFMYETMDPTMEYMQLLFALLEKGSPQALNDMESVGLGPHFAVSWIITWFTHVLPDLSDVHRLFDVFLAADDLMLLYLSAAVIIRSDEEVRTTPADFGLLHQTLIRLPKKHPVDDLVSQALQLFLQVGPDALRELGRKRAAMRSAVVDKATGKRVRAASGQSSGSKKWLSRGLSATVQVRRCIISLMRSSSSTGQLILGFIFIGVFSAYLGRRYLATGSV